MVCKNHILFRKGELDEKNHIKTTDHYNDYSLNPSSICPRA